MINKQDLKLAILGLGYVGLPLAVAFGNKRPVLGFDVNEKRIVELAMPIYEELYKRAI